MSGRRPSARSVANLRQQPSSNQDQSQHVLRRRTRSQSVELGNAGIATATASVQRAMHKTIQSESESEGNDNNTIQDNKGRGKRATHTQLLNPGKGDVSFQTVYRMLTNKSL